MRRFVSLMNGVLAVVVVATAAAALLSLAGARMDVLTHFALIYAVIGLLGAVWGVLTRRGPVVAAAVLALAASAWLIAPEFNRDAGPTALASAPNKVKVIQINALRRNSDIARVANWLVAQDPDIITVTEARHDLRDLLVKRGWKTAGAHGALMIFTRQRYVRMVRPLPRRHSHLTFVNATYASASGPLEGITTHLDWPTRPVIGGQLADLETVVGRRPTARMILTGDFNATPWSREIRRLDASLGLVRRDRAVPTWPAQVLGQPWPLPFLPIDHVYAGPGWATVKVERGPWVGSDHYPVVVTLAPVAPR